MRFGWRGEPDVTASGDGAVAAGRDVVNPRTEIHYHVHSAQPADAVLADSAPAVVFEARPVYPRLEFSIVNRGRTPVQITAIRVVKAASVQASYRGDGIEFITGPRLQLDFDLHTAESGAWTSAFSGRVSNLAPHEAEAFVLDLSSENTLNLVDIEFEYVSSSAPSTLVARSSQIIYVDSPMPLQGYGGSIQVLSRSAALSSLFDGAPAPANGPAIEACPEDARILFVRGVAQLAHSHVEEAWQEVVRRFGGTAELGPAVASFAEFGRACGLPDSVHDGLEAWLGDPAAIRRAPNWDYESHTLIVQSYLVEDLPPQRGFTELTVTRSAALCFKLLDSTLELESEAPSDENMSDLVRFIMAASALAATREKMLERLAGCYGAGTVEYLLVNLMLSPLSGAAQERRLQEIVGGDAPPSGATLDAVRIGQRWWTWWETHHDFPEYSKLQWRPCSPRLAKAASALFARTPEDVPAVMDDLVTLAVLRNPRVVDHFAASLVTAPEVQVRRELAMSRQVSPEVLDVLARDRSSKVRRWVASNPNAEDRTLAVLHDDEEEIVRSFLLQNPRLSTES